MGVLHDLNGCSSKKRARPGSDAIQAGGVICQAGGGIIGQSLPWVGGPVHDAIQCLAKFGGHWRWIGYATAGLTAPAAYGGPCCADFFDWVLTQHSMLGLDRQLKSPLRNGCFTKKANHLSNLFWFAQYAVSPPRLLFLVLNISYLNESLDTWPRATRLEDDRARHPRLVWGGRDQSQLHGNVSNTLCFQKISRK